MRKIYSQSIESHANQIALDNLAKSLGIAQSRVLERIITSIEVDDLVAIITRRFSSKTARVIQLDRATAQVIQDEIARSISLMSARVTDAANDGVRAGLMSILDLEDQI
ncbi:hypothetical protein CXF92_00315 [Pseudomonas sp. Choline-3u-10]|uniref:hypothetical protein n=1 Tax=Pseudomonas sp. Choline-3u-10 TaxID=2058311 RepID=UPI000C349671|nr:hypothetical protein [Pseudomonas sp. Choline-3u-10]PKG96279.1 hypothetical protein CXF92_00315 [Pseudomonas sp. Choline-3u-10]